MDAETFAESLQRFIMRKGATESTTTPMGLDADHFGFYVYRRDGKKFAVEVWEVNDAS